MDRRLSCSPQSSLYFSRRRPSITDPSQSSSDADSRPPKRPRLSSANTPSGSWTSTPNVQTQSEEEPFDLTESGDSSALAKALSKQREDAVKAQQDAEHNKGRSQLVTYKCPVCMDTLVDATSTVCGHLFCHKCIIDTLKFSEDQKSDHTGKTARGTCPVCRKPLARSDGPGPKRNLIPLKLKLATKKRSAVVGSSA